MGQLMTLAAHLLESATRILVGGGRHLCWKVIYTFTCSISIIPHMPGGDLLMLFPQSLVYIWPGTDAAKIWSLAPRESAS